MKEAYLYIALIVSYSSLGSQVWHVLRRDRSFTCRPHVYPQVELGIERVQACIANISHSRYVPTATQPVHQLQIRPLMHN